MPPKDIQKFKPENSIIQAESAPERVLSLFGVAPLESALAANEVDIDTIIAQIWDIINSGKDGDKIRAIALLRQIGRENMEMGGHVTKATARMRDEYGNELIAERKLLSATQHRPQGDYSQPPGIVDARPPEDISTYSPAPDDSDGTSETS